MYAQALAKQPQVIPGRDPMLDIKEDLQRLKNYNDRMAKQRAIELRARALKEARVRAAASDKLAGVMHAVIGGLASITETYIVDFFERLKAEPQLYRHTVKRDMNIVRKTIRQLIHTFYRFQKAANTHTMWCDLTDLMEEDLKMNLIKLRLCVLQAYRHHHIERDELFTDALLACNFGHMLATFLHDYNTLVSRHFNMQLNVQISDEIVRPVQVLHDTLYKVTNGIGLGDVEFTPDECQTMKIGFQAIERKFESYDWIEEMCKRSLELNGVVDTDNDTDDTSNNYTPWNEAQKGIIVHYYNQDGAEGVARMLHRSVGAVRRMYYRLKKTGKYENL